MRTNVLISHRPYFDEPYPWYYIVQGPLGDMAPGIDYGSMETQEQAEEAARVIVKDAEKLSIADLMDKYGTHWMEAD